MTHLSDEYQGIAGLVFVALLFALSIWQWRRRKRPRFITDERGERQRVDRWNRGQPVYKPKTWQQRVFEEATLRSQRRTILFWCIVMLACVGALAYWLWQYSVFFSLMVIGSAVFCAPLWIYGGSALVNELLYLLGYQGMEGAKVLDEQPKAQPGREIVEAQKAHGDARIAGEDEAAALLNSRK